MKTTNFTLQDEERFNLYIYHWRPDADDASCKGVVQIAHGMAETAARYARFAEALTEQGYIVYAHDHRGHGRTAASTEDLGHPGDDGFNWKVKNMAQVSKHIRNAHPTIPLYLMGHSMGSFLTQKYMVEYPHLVDGIILSGTNGPRGLLGPGRAIAKLEMTLRGDRHPSKLLNDMSFGSFNRAFRPTRTEFDWLSRDAAEVDKYIADPYCGFLCTSGFFYHFFGLLQEIHQPEQLQRIPKDLPIYVFSGDRDPVGLHGKGVRQLLKLYQELGLSNVRSKLYRDGRHEMLNEINRDEVTNDTIAWLDHQIESRSAQA
ncbi:alpha/beta hydrolase [Paenibacillus terrigena]|uniref:alpha/beta hydrolase n=1 Tax=Paenibacillus terrigena TaxID=369333 RepID=UPI0003754876|nr:alpha/beta hydrolase [Paenibacillus terrigena]